MASQSWAFGCGGAVVSFEIMHFVAHLPCHPIHTTERKVIRLWLNAETKIWHCFSFLHAAFGGSWYILFRLNVQASCVFHRNCRALTYDRNWNVFHSKNQKPLQPHCERLWIVVLAMQEVRLCTLEKFQMHREPPTFSWQNSFSTRGTSLRTKLSAKEDDLRAQEYAFVKLKSILTIKWKNVWTEHKSSCIQFFSSSFVCLFVSLGKWLGWL